MIECILADFQQFLCVSHTEKATSHIYYSARFDGLDADIEVRALAIGQKIIGLRNVYTANMATNRPPHVIRIILISYDVILVGGG